MPRLESDDGSSVSGSTLQSSPSFGALAKRPNATVPNGDLDESGHAQGPIEQESYLSAQQLHSEQEKHASTLSTIATRPDASLHSVSPSLPSKPLAGEGAKAPSQEHLSSEVTNLTKYLQDVSSQAAGQVLQTFWRKFLFGNGNEHLCWVLRAGIRNAPTPVIERVLKDSTIVNILAPIASKKQPVATAVLADLPYDELVEYIPETVLDREIRRRLKMMPAKPLIRWLAEAERLGFREDDVLDEEDESVMPNLSASDLITPGHYTGTAEKAAVGSTSIGYESGSGSADVEMLDGPRGNYNPSHHNSDQEHNATFAPPPQYPVAVPPSSSSTNPLACPNCRLVLPTASGYNYHITKKFCQVPPPPNGHKWSCQNCGRGFTTRQGTNYHINLAKVCFGDDIAPATSPRNQSQPQQLQQQPPQSATYPVSQYSDQAHPRPGSTAKPPRPPLQTPVPDRNGSTVAHSNVAIGRQETSADEPRMSPAELSPLKFAQLNKALADQEAKYQTSCADVDPNLGPREREARLQSLKNGHATKKSQIRRSFGVTLRPKEAKKTGRKPSLGTPSARRNPEDYRAESFPVRPSPLSEPPSFFSPINAPGNNASTQGAIPPENPVFRDPIEYQSNAYKRQRTNHSLPDQASESSSTGTGNRPLPQRDESAEPNYGQARLNGLTEGRADPSLSRAGPGAGTALANAPQYIEIVSTSEESGGDDMAGIPQRVSSPSWSHHATSNGQHAAGLGTEGRSFERKSTTGPSRGSFTARRGRH